MGDENELKKQIEQLREENRIFRKLLDKNHILYSDFISSAPYIESEEYDVNQGARIISQREITEEMANHFYAKFWGRQDVFAKRYENQKTGKIGYALQCDSRWDSVCPKQQGKRLRCQDCTCKNWTKLKSRHIMAHLKGCSYNSSDVVGVYPLLPNGMCRFLVFDFDNHKKGAEQKDFANEDDAWKEEVDALRKICKKNSIEPLVERSRSGMGAHIWLLFSSPIPATLARKFGFALLEKGAEQVNMKSFKYYDRMLPAQDNLPEGGVGNLIALPLQGQALKQGNSAFIDENWNAYQNQWNVLWGQPLLSQKIIEEKIEEWENPNTGKSYGSVIMDESGNRIKPWKVQIQFHKSNVIGKMLITLSECIYIDTINLKVELQNQIRRLAVFHNPIFYKNKAIGVQNFDTPSRIYMGEDESGYIKIPRGLLDKLLEKCNAAKIEYKIIDERESGRKINALFVGELYKEQKSALEVLKKYDIGILNAATAFGKTVVCSALIAEKKVNTLILLESSALIDQWTEALNKFLKIEEEYPIYYTKTGRKKTRKNLIGRLQGAHDSTTGIIDIAMVGSVCKKGEYHERLQNYGMVILDECHHAASETIAKILSKIKSKYVYGVTATPMRGDGLEKINFMLLGPVRYEYTAKEKAKEQGIPHFVYPRFTRVVAVRGKSKRMHPNEAYELIRNHEVRNQQIVEDVRAVVKRGRTPVVLSKYKNQSEQLFQKLQTDADHVFLMTGNNSKKEHKKIRLEMQKVPKNETMILIATGKLVGEGFDYPRLDTLFMATPVAWKGVVEQYVGRLNRDYEGKKDVIVYDYIDMHIPMFDNMYTKRLCAYKQIGYQIYRGQENAKPEANAIFDFETYLPVFQKDLLAANQSIIISSPIISGTKIAKLISFVKNIQEKGIKIIIVTWAPDNYGFGKSDYWLEQHERMRKAGFEIKIADDFCERYAILDEEIVWYGSMNFLGKEDVDDNLMRVCSKEIAVELMERTF
ncbi:MAG: DEAD/DEAH box helicase family protein [Anaerostipes sp.]|nr:DEAD/DEAH box helicase family protein [Anaerostipes sp.]